MCTITKCTITKCTITKCTTPRIATPARPAVRTLLTMLTVAMWLAVPHSQVDGQSRTPQQPAASTGNQLADIVRAWLGMGQPASWASLDQLPGIRWSALPPTSLTNCLADGSCFTRQGAGTIDGRNMIVVATGARTMVMHLYVRSSGAPHGAAAIVAALERQGISSELARCPVRGGTGSTTWYRLRGEGVAPATLAVQLTRTATPTEGLVLSSGTELPPLQPNQLAMYSTDCTAGATQRAVSTAAPHKRVAEVVAALLVPISAPHLAWPALVATPIDVTWDSAGPKAVDYAAIGDRNPMSLSGLATWSERRFSVRASGTAAQVTAIFLDETGLHPRGEHMLGAVYDLGFVVRLVRCGPVYTTSTNNWYSITSARTRPAMLRQSIRYDGNRVSDQYELRLDGLLPSRDPRDRDPGVGGCQ